jgi:hypothetical protein
MDLTVKKRLPSKAGYAKIFPKHKTPFRPRKGGNTMKRTNVSRLLVSLLALCLMLSMTPAVFAANDLVVETGSDVSISSSTPVQAAQSL